MAGLVPSIMTSRIHVMILEAGENNEKRSETLGLGVAPCRRRAGRNDRRSIAENGMRSIWLKLMEVLVSDRKANLILAGSAERFASA
ncbi:hypothetical protein BSN85_18140 [Bradyrhizobium brasilense]|nr:hypothetical protein BSN85_18140 [Bradyrhizobium brasilense]